jgi:hypothetical protein
MTRSQCRTQGVEKEGHPFSSTNQNRSDEATCRHTKTPGFAGLHRDVRFLCDEPEPESLEATGLPSAKTGRFRIARSYIEQKSYLQSGNRKSRQVGRAYLKRVCQRKIEQHSTPSQSCGLKPSQTTGCDDALPMRNYLNWQNAGDCRAFQQVIQLSECQSVCA